MKGIDKIYCASSTGVTEEPKMEGLWSECFQDLGSWCRQPQDELNTPQISNQNEFMFSFDDQSKYCKWDASSPIGLPGDMWDSADNLLSPPLQLEEDNNNLSIQPLSTLDKSISYKDYIKKEVKESPIRYSGNLVLTQCSYDILPESKDWRSGSSGLLPVQKGSLPSASTQNLYNMHHSDLDHKWEEFGEIKEETNTFKVPEEKAEEKKERPSLKLNIAAAKANSNSDIEAFSMNTPDVLKSLSEDPGFSLISFVCDGYEESNLLGTDTSSVGLQPDKIVHTNSNLGATSQQANPETIKSDHDYTDSRAPEEETVTYSDLVSIKDEPASPAHGHHPYLGKRIRRSTATSDDFILDSDPLSDNSSDWSPSQPKKVKTKRRNTKANSKHSSKRSRKSSESDSCSVVSGPDRYRELRDRNNEASRRSRMNRKQKEVEMLDLASSLEGDNAKLKQKAILLENRVKALREILMKVVLERNSAT